MVGIVVGVLLLCLVVFSIVRAVQWLTKTGPFNTYGRSDEPTAQARRELRAQIERGRQEPAPLRAEDLDDPWCEGEEFGPPVDGPDARR